MPLDFEFNPPIGIDLGTTFSAIARWNGVLADSYDLKNGTTMQSVVFLQESGKYLVGKTAYKNTLVYPEAGIVGVKRKMDNREEKIRLRESDHSPIEISAKILSAIHDEVNEQCARRFRPRGVVVTVPYYFKAHQCANTREAADLAGLNCIGILQEPIAASLQYALQIVRDAPKVERDEVILVFDLGGGTFDLTLFRLGIHAQKLTFEVLAAAGDDRLGGLDFDDALVAHVLREEKISLDSLDEKSRRRTRHKLLDQARSIKETLSSTDEELFVVADVLPPDTLHGLSSRSIERNISRSEFEAAINPHITKVQRCVDDLFVRSGFRPEDVTRVIKVGGSSKIPAMTRILSEALGEDKVYGNIKVDLCVAEGAAIYAAYLDDREVFGRDIEITTRTCHALGVEVDGGAFCELITANRKSPCERSQLFEPIRPSDTEISINVFQGSGRMVKDNTKVGTVHVPREGASWPEQGIDVTFRLDEEQTLTVKAKVGSQELLATFQTS